MDPQRLWGVRDPRTETASGRVDRAAVATSGTRTLRLSDTTMLGAALGLLERTSAAVQSVEPMLAPSRAEPEIHKGERVVLISSNF